MEVSRVLFCISGSQVQGGNQALALLPLRDTDWTKAEVTCKKPAVSFCKSLNTQRLSGSTGGVGAETKIPRAGEGSTPRPSEKRAPRGPDSQNLRKGVAVVSTESLDSDPKEPQKYKTPGDH